MVPLRDTKLAWSPKASPNMKASIILKTLLLLLSLSLSVVFSLLHLSVIGRYIRWTYTMLFFMVTFMKKSTSFHHWGTVDRGSILCVVFTNPYMVSNRHLKAGSISSHLLYKLLVSFSPKQIILCLHKWSIFHCYIVICWWYDNHWRWWWCHMTLNIFLSPISK